MATSNRTSSAVVYNAPPDWWELYDDMQSKARGGEFWNELQGIKPWLKRPVEPAMESFPHNRPSSWDQIQQMESQTMDQKGPKTGKPPKGSHTPVSERSDNARDANRALRISDLTANGEINYLHAFDRWKIALEEYEMQREKVRAFQNWLLASIAPIYRTICCDGGTTLDVWYTKLRGTALAEIATAGPRCQEELNDVLRPFTRPTSRQKYEEWLQRWELAMARSDRQQLPEVAEAIVWTDRFFFALRGVFNVWTTTYRMANEEAIRNNTISFFEVSGDFRVHLYRVGESSPDADDSSEMREGGLVPSRGSGSRKGRGFRAGRGRDGRSEYRRDGGRRGGGKRKRDFRSDDGHSRKRKFYL